MTFVLVVLKHNSFLDALFSLHFLSVFSVDLHINHLFVDDHNLNVSAIRILRVPSLDIDS